MDQRLFGPWGWLLLHAIAYAYKLKGNLSQDDQEWIKKFLSSFCRLLPCPGCSYHCIAHIAQNIPNFQNGEEFWKYTVDFHNSVNQRSNLLQYSYEEAETLLTQNLSGFNLANIQNSFIPDIWIIVLFIGHHFAGVRQYLKDQKENENFIFKPELFDEFLISFCHVLPFSNQSISLDMFEKFNQIYVEKCETSQENSSPKDKRLLIRDIMLEKIRNEKNIDYDSEDSVIEAITSLYNSACVYFGVPLQTKEGMKSLLYSKMSVLYYADVVRSNQTRIEDHKKMMALQDEINALRGKGNKNNDKDDCETWKIVCIILASLLGVIVILLSFVFISYKFSLFGEWKIIRFHKNLF
jgi:hypothetical protein